MNFRIFFEFLELALEMCYRGSFAANLKCEGDLPVKRIVIANR